MNVVFNSWMITGLVDDFLGQMNTKKIKIGVD